MVGVKNGMKLIFLQSLIYSLFISTSKGQVQYVVFLLNSLPHETSLPKGKWILKKYIKQQPQ